MKVTHIWMLSHRADIIMIYADFLQFFFRFYGNISGLFAVFCRQRRIVCESISIDIGG